MGYVKKISAEGEKQGSDNMNKICELLTISILMTNHHANQFILCPQIADWCWEIWVHGNASEDWENAQRIAQPLPSS